MTKIRVLIADDHLVVREGLIVMLQSADDFKVVGQAKDGQEAVDLAAELCPDVAILDIKMPKITGIEATQRIRRHNPAVQVVVLSTFDQDDYIYDALQAGAKGYIVKDSGLSELLSVVRAAARGESILPPQIATRLVERLSAQQTERNLTNRELEVLKLVAEGLRNREIAKQLHITERTVKNHVAKIIAKLGVKSRTEAVSQAVKEKLIKFGK